MISLEVLGEAHSFGACGITLAATRFAMQLRRAAIG